MTQLNKYLSRVSIKSLACLTCSIAQINRPNFCLEGTRRRVWKNSNIFKRSIFIMGSSASGGKVFFSRCVFYYLGHFLYKLNPTARHDWNQSVKSTLISFHPVYESRVKMNFYKSQSKRRFSISECMYSPCMWMYL